MGWTWVALGTGAALAAGGRLAYVILSASPAGGTGAGGANANNNEGRHARMRSATAALMPSTVSIRIAGCVAAPSVVFFAYSTAVASLRAAVMAGASVALGAALDSYLCKEQRDAGGAAGGGGGGGQVHAANSAVAVVFGAPTVGALVKATGLSLTTMWLTSQVSEELVPMVVVCAIGMVPAAYEVRSAWVREGDWVRTAVADQVCAAADEVFDVGAEEVSAAWAAHGLGRTATYGEAFELLRAYSDDRLRRFSRRAAERFDDLPGVPTAAANAMDRAIVAVASSALERVLLSPQAMLEQNPALAEQRVTREQILEQMHRAGEAVAETLRAVILGEIGVFEFLASRQPVAAGAR